VTPLTTAIIVPCYNEAGRLPVAVFKAYMDAHPETHFFFVNDGSHDKTLEVLLRLGTAFPRQARVISYTSNRGKAEAVRAGILDALGSSKCIDILGFWDADLATPLDELPKFLETFSASPRVSVVIGSRRESPGAISRTWFRKATSACIAWAIHHLIRVPFADTQCGAKLFRRSIAERVFERPFKSKWLFDVEIFKRIRALHSEPLESCVAVHPLTRWTDVPGSKLTVFQAGSILAELLSLCLTGN
jgi:dolichyl-phosphate beta-glucosyltransferase